MRRWRLLIFGLLASLLIHGATAWLLPAFFEQNAHDFAQPERVSISTAARIDKLTRPQRAMHRLIPQPPQVARVTRHQAAPVVPPHLRPRISKSPRPIPPQSPQLTQAQLDAQMRSFERTIAQAKAAANPLAGAVRASVTPEAPKRYAFNVAGSVGSPLPEGTLTPIRRWKQGDYVYYYVHYDVEYVDGGTESGDVPWPIRFPANADPFRAGNRFPLPGPPANYIAPDDAQLNPLIKNCYDHRYSYCPIARDLSTAFEK
jgi:hypothetical protein